MIARYQVAQPSRLRVPAASRGEGLQISFARRDATRTPGRGRLRYEQRRIGSEVDALKPLQAETAAELGALLPTFLDRAVKGEF